MKAVLALIALLPAAVGAAPPRDATTLALCGGGAIAIPLTHPDIPGAQQPGCCAKGCHTGGARKKNRWFDRAQ